MIMKKTLTTLAAALALTACTGPMYVTSVPTYNKTVDEVVAAIEGQGYILVNKSHDFKNNTRHSAPPFEGNVNSSDWIPQDYVSVDIYSFVDSVGNTMSFDVQYRAGVDRTNSTVYYYDVQTAKCTTSNPEHYDRLCGKSSPVWRLYTIQKDLTVKP